jgi:hypothetical protein
MKIKELIQYLGTLDEEKELVIIVTDPTGWDYGMVVESHNIELEEVYPSNENGLEGELKTDEDQDEVECYTIRLTC